MILLNIYIGILIAITTVFAAIFFYNFKNRSSLSFVFGLFSFFSAIYLIGVIGQFKSNDLAQIIFFQKIKYIGFPFIFPMFVLFLYKVNFSTLPKYKYVLIFFFIPILLSFLVNTNDYHHLYYKSISFQRLHGYSIVQKTPGLLYFIGPVYSIALFGFGLYLIFKYWSDQSEQPKILKASFIASFVVTLMLRATCLFRLLPHNFDLTPVAAFVQLIGALIAIYHFQIFNIAELQHVMCSSLKEGIIVVNKKFQLVYYNQSAKASFHWLNLKTLGKSLKEMPEGNRIIANSNDNFILDFHKSGQTKYFSFKPVTLKRRNSIEGYAFSFYDATKEVSITKKLEHAIKIDGLTNVYNQSHIVKKLEEGQKKAIQNKDRFSVIVIDLNDFKKINDAWGHLYGNMVLQRTAAFIKEIFSCENCLYGRFGGDEFLIACKTLTKENVFDLCQQLIDSVTLLNGELNKEPYVTISVGIYYSDYSKPETTESITDLINGADLAMYKAKNKGLNLIEYYNKKA